MTQLIVTLDNNAPLPSLRKAIGLLKGVVSTAVYPVETLSAQRQAQQAYVRESLTTALDELQEAKRSGRKLQKAEDFLAELDMAE